MRLEHPIFKGPLEPGVVLDSDHKWEQEYDDRGTWLVHHGEYPEVDVGVVSDGFGFEDSPDCERIAGGINSKGPEAVAIGRQANMLQWGFYGAPDRMTGSAKKVFLNALVYMTRFDGQRPLVEKKALARSSILRMIRFIPELEGMDEESRADLERYLEGQFPAALIEAHGLDVAALTAWYHEKQEFFTTDGEWGVKVDADLERLGLSNRRPEFFDTLLARLADDPHDELSLTLARRYVGEEPGRSRATLAAWVEANRSRLFFTDTGGFRWMVDTRAQRAEAGAQARTEGLEPGR